jgi:hypothetical protein
MQHIAFIFRYFPAAPKKLILLLCKELKEKRESVILLNNVTLVIPLSVSLNTCKECKEILQAKSPIICALSAEII